ncbi:hypothetical protein [uncultured Cellulomonas sp.]|uniref:hypothetical protein n=1 Tax=uncultured Cellulomonas sp. TaxID=189682 RepID=UPI00262F3DB2|nr:hypothetical protein [uncultured Cellulomonas sp.]
MSGPTQADDAGFDPTLVPVFPVLTVELTSDGGARLNGRQLTVAPGQNPSDVAMEAAANEARLMPGDRGAVRVRGVDPGGRVFPLVVRADGAVFELPTESPAERGGRPAWLVPAITGAVALVLGGGIVGAAFAVRAETDPAPTTTAPPPLPLPGAGANLPVPAPPGYAQRATWAVPVSERVRPVATASGDVLAVRDDGDLVLFDDLTGRVLWTGQDAPRSGELHLLDDTGIELAAATAGRTLLLWPLPEPAATTPAPSLRATAPVVVTLPSGARASFEGSAPLVTLQDQTAAIITQGALDLVDVPVGASAVAADSDSVLAVSIAGTLYDLVPGAEPVERTLARPPGPDPRPVRSIGAGADHVIVVWAAGDQQWVVLHDVSTGAIASYAATDTDLTRAKSVRQQGAGRLTVGHVLVTFDGATDAVALPAELQPEVVTTGHVYGDLEREPVDVSTDASRAVVEQIPVDELATPDSPTPFPIATSPSHAYVTASKVEQYLLHAVPSTGGTP